MSLFNLKDKSILITGSSRGIGKAIAKHCAMHGANVIISSRKEDACIETANEINSLVGEDLAYPIAASISNTDQLELLVSKTREKYGKIDVLICNAATNPFMGSMLDMPSEKFDKVMENNIKSNQFLCNLVIPEMVDRNDGSIIIISSIGGLKGSSILVLITLVKLLTS